MLTSKRKADDVDLAQFQPSLLDEVNHMNKRRCAPTDFCSAEITLSAGVPSIPTQVSPTASQFLYGLAQSAAGGSQVLGAFSEHTWVCFAELNLLCNTYFSQMPASFLRGYHSYTRLPKDMLWSRFISPLGNPPPSQDSLKTQEKMTGFLMEHLFTNQPEAGIVKYTLKVCVRLFFQMHLSGLIEWGTRWGLMSTNGIVNVLAVMAYAPGDASSSSGTSPAQAFYVPAFE
eukprot:gene12726-15972_t